MDGDAQVSGKVVLNEVSCAVGRPIVDNQDFSRLGYPFSTMERSVP